MRIALRYIAAPVLAASFAGTIAAAAASATAETQPARTTDTSTASADHGSVYCGQFCGSYNAYSNQPNAAAAPAPYGVGRSRLNPLSPAFIRLPIVDDAGALVPQH